MNIDFLQEPPSIDINGIENSTDFIISKNTSNVVPDRRSDEGCGFRWQCDVEDELTTDRGEGIAIVEAEWRFSVAAFESF